MEGSLDQKLKITMRVIWDKTCSEACYDDNRRPIDGRPLSQLIALCDRCHVGVHLINTGNSNNRDGFDADGSNGNGRDNGDRNNGAK